MQEKIMQVFYGSDRLPYKDNARLVHYPNVGNVFTGENNVTNIRFYVTQIGGSDFQWVANIVTQSGGRYSRVLPQVVNDNEEQYVELDISDLYSSTMGKINISLQGYNGANITYNDESEEYEINGDPTILATGSILIIANYTPNTFREERLEPTLEQQMLGAISTRMYSYDKKTILKYESLEEAESNKDKLAENQVILVKVGDYYTHKIKSGSSLVDIATQQATQFTIGGIYNTKEDLPSASEETSGKIFLVKSSINQGSYIEFITIYNGNGFYWEQIGVSQDDVYPSVSVMRSLPRENINGKQLGAQWTATYTEATVSYFTIKYLGGNITRDSAISWLKFATGVETLPTFNANSPKQVYIMFIADQDYGTLIRKGNPILCKVQWEQGGDEYGQLKLYVVNTFNELGELKITNGTGGIKITTNHGHDVEFYNMETGSKFAIYRCNTNKLIILQDAYPHPNNTICLGSEDNAFKEIVSRKAKAILETRKSASNYCLRIETQTNNNTSFRVVLNPDSDNEYVVPAFMVNVAGDLLPLVNNQRKLGDMGIEWKEVWTPKIKTSGKEIDTKDISMATLIENEEEDLIELGSRLSVTDNQFIDYSKSNIVKLTYSYTKVNDETHIVELLIYKELGYSDILSRFIGKDLDVGTNTTHDISGKVECEYDSGYKLIIMPDRMTFNAEIEVLDASDNVVAKVYGTYKTSKYDGSFDEKAIYFISSNGWYDNNGTHEQIINCYHKRTPMISKGFHVVTLDGTDHRFDNSTYTLNINATRVD